MLATSVVEAERSESVDCPLARARQRRRRRRAAPIRRSSWEGQARGCQKLFIKDSISSILLVPYSSVHHNPPPGPRGAVATLAISMTVSAARPQLPLSSPLLRLLLCAFGAVTAPGATVRAFDNSCLLSKALQPPTRDAPQTFLQECPAWVINTTDEVWNTKPHVNESLDRYFAPGFSSSGSFGTRYEGVERLKAAVASTQRAFPDLRIHISDVFCVGNDVDGYKTVMPDVLTGTNTGISEYGPPTGRKVTYSGIAVTYVQRSKTTGEWQYVAEWVLHDELSLVAQLGLSPGHASQLNGGTKPGLRRESAVLGARTLQTGWCKATARRPNQCRCPNELSGPWTISSAGTSTASTGTLGASVHPFWTVDMVYDTNYVDAAAQPVLGNNTGFGPGFCMSVPWNLAFPNCTFSQLIFAGEDATATTRPTRALSGPKTSPESRPQESPRPSGFSTFTAWTCRSSASPTIGCC